MKRLCVCLYFRAPLGGLQENVLSTVCAAASAGYQVSVLCPAGPFLDDHVRLLGVNLLAVDFQSESSLAQAKQALCQADLIHAHPGPSRVLALEAADVTGVPVVFTIHGKWFDNVQDYAKRLAAIVCISPAVKEAVSYLCPGYLERIHYIPNGVDFARLEATSGSVPEQQHVSVVSRLDADKQMLVDTLIGLWVVQARRGTPRALQYTVAGQGTLQSELQAAAKRFGIPVHFSGWLDSSALAHLYKRSAVVIASGRAALEALACGRPTLALASVGAAEVFDPSQLPMAAYSNFGGYGAKPVQSLDTLFDKLYAAAMHLEAKYANKFSMFVQAQHENMVVNQRLLNLYGRVS